MKTERIRMLLMAEMDNYIGHVENGNLDRPQNALQTLREFIEYLQVSNDLKTA
jgi:hypothetical protein